MSGTINARLKDLSITLPPATAPVANYVPVVRSGNLLFVSGQICLADGKPVVGKLGNDVSVEDGAAAADGLRLAPREAARRRGIEIRVRESVVVWCVALAAPGVEREHGALPQSEV